MVGWWDGGGMTRRSLKVQSLVSDTGRSPPTNESRFDFAARKGCCSSDLKKRWGSFSACMPGMRGIFLSPQEALD